MAYRYLVKNTNIPIEIIKIISEYTGMRQEWIISNFKWCMEDIRKVTPSTPNNHIWSRLCELTSKYDNHKKTFEKSLNLIELCKNNYDISRYFYNRQENTTQAIL